MVVVFFFVSAAATNTADVIVVVAVAYVSLCSFETDFFPSFKFCLTEIVFLVLVHILNSIFDCEFKLADKSYVLLVHEREGGGIVCI